MCSEYALALVGAVGRNINVHLLIPGCRDFCFTCIWNSCFPFGFEFYHDAKFMQEVTASIKSASQVQEGLIQDEHRAVLEDKPQTAPVAEKLIVFVFRCVVSLLLIGGFIIIISSLILQDTCTQCRAEHCQSTLVLLYKQHFS